jgi:intracellular septation protein
MTFESDPNHETVAEKKLNPWLKLTLEMGPLALFFLANFYGARATAAFPALASLGGPIFLATATFIVVSYFTISQYFCSMVFLVVNGTHTL